MDSPTLPKTLELNMSAKAPPTLNQLVGQLVERIRGPLSLEEPFIIQDRIPETRSRHVVVVWDALDGMDRTQRSRIISDAFVEAGVDDSIRVATGLTQQETVSRGYLPYQIMANWKEADGPRILQSLKRAIEAAPGVHARTGISWRLHYPTLEHAQEAYRHLSAVVPGPYWAIVKDEGASE
jgi:hypothetical protein